MKHLLTILICSWLFCFATVVKAQKKSSSQGFSFVTPVTGMSNLPVWTTDSTVNIKWNSAGSGNVYLLLIDMHLWAVYKTITASTPDNGSYKWKIPTGIRSGVYEVYIMQLGPSPTWSYSSDFVIVKKNYPSPNKNKQMKIKHH